MMQQQPPAYTPSQTQMAPQHQVVTVQQGAAQVVSSGQSRPGNWKSMKVTGVMQIVLGGLTVVLGIVACAIQAYFYFVGHAFWCGLGFYCVAGILGTVSGVKANQGAAIGYMVMCIFACFAACTVIGFSATAVAVDAGSCYYYYGCNETGRVAVDAMLVILAVAEFIIAIVGASVTCSAVCCSTPSSTVIHYQAHPHVVVAGQPQGAVAYYSAPGQPQFAYSTQQVFTTPQGQYLPPPQGQAPAQAAPQAAPQAPPTEHHYQPLAK
ncbi:membrane-spanning 4-domains subfamily A member 4A-like [Acanthaster planci]|uniref:Membrane-spanning 4-domains subfamily A member 4A-like n=1 Tax=Acanthaster planci TaxID=133434 RepID=A0A8B7Y8F7_ACAPL|nr:membrane-spanning 4-domains subfamily A member 4A-like [Acanthaster planci]